MYYKRARIAADIMVFLLMGFMLFNNCAPDYDYSSMQLTLLDGSGAAAEPIGAIETGQSLSIGFSGLSPAAPVEVYLNDDAGKEWSYARMYADGNGMIEPSLFWYNTGVIGTTSRKIDFRPDPSFVTFGEAEEYFQQHRLILSVRGHQGTVVAEQEMPFRRRTGPLVYPSDSAGVLMNSFNVESENVYVTGLNIPAGATVLLYTTPNQYIWKEGNPLRDITGRRGTAAIDTVVLDADETSFIAAVWDHRHGRPGAYDIVARINDPNMVANLRPTDILAFGEDTGFLYYVIINGNVVIDASGRQTSGDAYFEFSDAFEKGEDVWGAVDPTDVPAVHTGGNYAAYYVVEHKPETYWDGASPTIVDVTGTPPEIRRVKYWCINVSRARIWPGAMQTDPMKAYDVIVDFGDTPAMDASSFVEHWTYNKGVDFIDGYNKVGFWLYEDPSSTGPYAIGTVEVDDAHGISGIPKDPGGWTAPHYDITLAWANIMYPATSAGVGTPPSTTPAPYPVALFLHGRHRDCDNDGDGPGLIGVYTEPGDPPCPDDHRIPSHKGYNYIMERLATQGIFCISISAHQIQHDNSQWNYWARGMLVLKWLDLLRDWNDNGSDPFGGLFQGKLNMSRVALSGHSRGGEGVVAAQELNTTWPNPHLIVAVNAIAPTDQNGAYSYLMEHAPYYLLVGARDGDVDNMQGFRTYDRSFPDGAPNRHPKMNAFVYGANHNYFNTIWTDAAALGSPNPWAASEDDAYWFSPPYKMSATDQRQVARSTICAFFRRHLQDVEPYKEILTGRVRLSAMPNDYVYWTYQDAERVAVDNFEQIPEDILENSLEGTVSFTAPTMFDEKLLNHDWSDYPPTTDKDSRFYHDTRGLILSWTASQTYETLIPAGKRDFSGYTHLTFRAAKAMPPGSSSPGGPLTFNVNIMDGSGNTGKWHFSTGQFDVVPAPYDRGSTFYQSLMTGVRIPMRVFTLNNSGVDLGDIAKIEIRTAGSGEAGIDDIEFGK